MYNPLILKRLELALAQGDAGDVQSILDTNPWIQTETGSWLEEVRELYATRLANATRVQRQVRACGGHPGLLISIIEAEGMHPRLMEELDDATVELAGYRLVFERGETSPRIRPVAEMRLYRDLDEGTFGTRAALIPDSYWTTDVQKKVMDSKSMAARVARSFSKEGRELPAWLEGVKE